MREKPENGVGVSKPEPIFFERRRWLNKVFLKTLKRLEFPKGSLSMQDVSSDQLRQICRSWTSVRFASAGSGRGMLCIHVDRMLQSYPSERYFVMSALGM